MRVVLDTNIFVSALLTPTGSAARIVDEWIDGAFTMLVHEQLIEEVRIVTRRPHFVGRIKRVKVGSLVNQLKEAGTDVGRLKRVDLSPDPKDNYLLALAAAGGADYLVTGDKPGLLTLGRFERTQIVTARAFLDRLLH